MFMLNFNFKIVLKRKQTFYLTSITNQKRFMEWIPVPKVPFCVFDKLKNEIQKFILRFYFYLNMENEIQIIHYHFRVQIDFYFESLMLSFSFHFSKKEENEIQFVFRFSFSWKNWKANYLNRSRLNYRHLVQIFTLAISFSLKKYQRNTGTVACNLCFNVPETYL